MGWQKIVTNPITGESVLITGSTHEIVSNKHRVLETRWEKELARERAKDLSEKSNEEILSFKNILSATLSHDDRVSWEELRDARVFQDPPIWDEFVPHFSWISNFFPGAKAKRQAAIQEAEKRFIEAVKTYSKEKQTFLDQQNEVNARVDSLKDAYEAIMPDAVVEYIRLVFQRSQYPDSINLDPQIVYEKNSNLMLVEIELPSPDEIPHVAEFSYSPSKNEIVTKGIKQREFDELYNSVLFQIVLRTVHEIFEADYVHAVDIVGVNGYVSGVDQKTGKDFRNCVLSLQVNRLEFEAIRLDRISPQDCFRHLKGISAGTLVNLAPVKPILQLNTVDKRIIEAGAVLGELTESQNLATMDWQQFEILIRDLFQREFGTEGSRVEVTRASRDEGVDAIAYDPDPIRGGKFVIQAKRYNNLVPVSAVRDLYGTLVNEGAVKGILVTTSYFGPGALDFAKDKPITLLNGGELMHMFNRHGYKVKIELQKKGPVTT